MSERVLTTRSPRFVLTTLAPEPWRNGGGWTRTVASASDARGLLWRISAADIERDGPFSAFDGLDRTAALMQGEGLELTGEGLAIRFSRTGDIARFPGEAALRARLAGGPARLWNVMVRRAKLRAEVLVEQGSAPTAAGIAPGRVPAPIAETIVVLAGRLRVCWPDGAPESVLAIGEGLVLIGDTLAPRFQPLATSPAPDDGHPDAPPRTASVPAAHWIRTRILPAS